MSRKTIVILLMILIVSGVSFSQELTSIGVCIGPSLLTGVHFNTHYPGGSVGVVFNLGTPITRVGAALGISYALHPGKTITYMTSQNGTEYINPVEHAWMQLFSVAAAFRYGNRTGPFLFAGPTANRFFDQNNFSFGLEGGVGWVFNRQSDKPKFLIMLKHNTANLIKQSGDEKDTGIAVLILGFVI